MAASRFLSGKGEAARAAGDQAGMASNTIAGAIVATGWAGRFMVGFSGCESIRSTRPMAGAGGARLDRRPRWPAPGRVIVRGYDLVASEERGSPDVDIASGRPFAGGIQTPMASAVLAVHWLRDGRLGALSARATSASMSRPGLDPWLSVISSLRKMR